MENEIANNNDNNMKESKRKIKVIVAILVLVLALAGIIFLVFMNVNLDSKDDLGLPENLGIAKRNGLYKNVYIKPETKEDIQKKVTEFIKDINKEGVKTSNLKILTKEDYKTKRLYFNADNSDLELKLFTDLKVKEYTDKKHMRRNSESMSKEEAKSKASEILKDIDMDNEYAFQSIREGANARWEITYNLKGSKKDDISNIMKAVISKKYGLERLLVKRSLTEKNNKEEKKESPKNTKNTENNKSKKESKEKITKITKITKIN